MNDVLRDRLELALKNNKTPRSLGRHSTGVDFSSNDYLGLAKNQVKNTLPSGSTGSRLLTGNSALAEEAESSLARSFGYENCLIYPSGYMANIGILSCLPQRGDTIFFDQFSHACIKDGARLSLASHQSFHHNDLDDLERRLKKSEGNSFVVVESIYSMDGDEAPLPALVHLCQACGAGLIIDEAHATAVRGKHGGGIVEELSLQKQILAAIYTFGKGMGAHGAAIASDSLVRDFLVNFSRPFIYTTGLPSSVYQHLLDVQEEILEVGSRRQNLQGNIDFFRTYWRQKTHLKMELLPSHSAIQAVVIPGNENARRVAQALQADGFDVRPILAPTVPEGKERIRICLHAYNTKEEISGLITSFEKITYS